MTIHLKYPCSIEDFTFTNRKNATLYVPSGCKAAYEAADYWKEFKEIVEMDEEQTDPDPSTLDDTDISQLDNVAYIEKQEGLVGKQLVLPVKMKNAMEVQGFQFDLVLPEGVTVAEDEDGFLQVELSTERTSAKKTDYFNTELQPDGSLRVLCASTKGYTFSDNDGEVARVTVNISEDMAIGDYPLVLRTVTLSDTNAQKVVVDCVKSTLTIDDYTLGDANNDGVIDVADFIAIANFILGKQSANFVEKAADADGDGIVDVADFIAVANMILKGSTANTAKAMMPGSPQATAATGWQTAENAIYVEPLSAEAGQQVLSVRMKNSADVQGFQFDLQLPAGVTIATNDDSEPMVRLSTERTSLYHTDYLNCGRQSDGSLRVLCGSTKGYAFCGSEGEVVQVVVNVDPSLACGSYPVTVKTATLSDTDAHSLPAGDTTTMMQVGGTTGVQEIDFANGGAPERYDLQGRRVQRTQLPKGVYVVGGKKVVVK